MLIFSWMYRSNILLRRSKSRQSVTAKLMQQFLRSKERRHVDGRTSQNSRGCTENEKVFCLLSGNSNQLRVFVTEMQDDTYSLSVHRLDFNLTLPSSWP